MKLSLKQKQQIIAYFRLQPEVAGVYLYGSQVTGGAGNLSDVDLAVLLRKTIESKRFVNRVGMLYPDFYPVLQNYYQKMQERLEKGTYAA